MKCSKCGTDIAEGSKFCSVCGTAVPTVKENSSHSGVSVGDIGYIEGGITDASTHGAASVGSISINLGRSEQPQDKASPALVECPLCGHQNEVSDTFRCPKCGRKKICLRHQDEETFYCQVCTAKIRQLLEQSESAFTGCRWTQAEDVLKRLLDLEPDHSKAREILREVREKETQLRKLLKEAEAAEGSNSLEKAIGLLNEAITLSPEEEFLEDKKASLEQALDERKEAEKQSEIPVLMENAESALETRRWPEAEKILTRILELDPEYNQAKALLEETREKGVKLKGLLKEIDAAERFGDFEVAISALEKAIRLSAEEGAVKERKARLEKALEEKRQKEIEKQRQAGGEKRRREEAERKKEEQERLERERRRRAEREKAEEEGKKKAAEEKKGKDQLTKQSAAQKESPLEKGRWKKRTLMITAAGFFVLVLACFLVYQGRKSSEPPSIYTNNLGMKFVYIKPASFMMGSPSKEPGHDSDEKRHRVTLTKGFYMQTTEVTQGQWKKVMRNNPSYFRKCGDDCPVEQVSWNDVQKFIKKLNRMEKTDKYRLPTEAEWEYACRAGTTTPFSFGQCLSTDQANYNGNHPLAECLQGSYRKTPNSSENLPPNTLGLQNMHGNVWEWCQDRYRDYPSGSVTDPEGPASGSSRVFRGGGWSSRATRCRSANRDKDTPGGRNNSRGFRLASQAGDAGVFSFLSR